MHSRIFEVSKTPISEKDQITGYDLPEWFCIEIADYVDDVFLSEREENLCWFTSRFDENCTREADKISFHENVKEEFFKTKYKTFLTAASAALTCTLEEFIGKSDTSSLNTTMYLLKDSFEDRFGFYIYDRDMEELMTLDSWVRRSDLTKDYYFGGVIDYHF